MSGNKGFIGLISLLIVALIIGLWFTFSSKTYFGTKETPATLIKNEYVESPAQKGAIQQAKDVKALIENKQYNVQ